MNRTIVDLIALASRAVLDGVEGFGSRFFVVYYDIGYKRAQPKQRSLPLAESRETVSAPNGKSFSPPGTHHSIIS